MNLLWQKDSKNLGLYVDLFNNVPSKSFDLYMKRLSETASTFAGLKLNQKNDKMSSQLRRDGNVKFKNDDWLEAMSLYNKSLCYAEIGSENVGLAYANRSACFFRLEMFSECLVDIELAKRAKYPLKMMSKLDERRNDCLRLMKAHQNKNELSYDSDEMFPGMADVLEIRCDAVFGRHIVAKCDIPAGKTVLVEKAFITRLLNTSYNSCAICMKISTNFIACSRCTTSLFCSSECANVNDIHELDCAELRPGREGDPLEYYIGTLIFIVSSFPTVESLIEFVEDAINDKKDKAPDSLDDVTSKFRAILQFSWNNCPTTEKSHERLNEAHMIYRRLSLRKSTKKLFDTEEKKRFLMHLVLHLNCVMINNSFDAGKGLQMSIYIISAYFNHSCAPNILGINTHKNVRYCRTVRPIKAGQQLFISYLGDLSTQPDKNLIREVDSDQRQQMLFENYGFACKCERCVPDVVSRETNAKNLRSDRFFQWFHTNCDRFMNENVGATTEKAALVEKKMVELLNRFGDRQWCDELASIVANYENLFINFPLEL